MNPSARKIRAKLLELIAEQNTQRSDSSALQMHSVLREAQAQLGIGRNPKAEQKVLTEWNELFRTGFLAWGHDFNNEKPPFFHVTDRGSRALELAHRDPSNPEGYVTHLQLKSELGPISKAYLSEALDCYVAGSFKAAAVLIGAASERLVL